MGKDTEREIIGLIEFVTVKGQIGKERVEAKIDTGADRSSVDQELAAKVGLGPITDTVKVRSALGERKTRIVTDAEIILNGQSFKVPVSIGDRSNMKYGIIIGKDILTQCDFLIDPTKEEH